MSGLPAEEVRIRFTRHALEQSRLRGISLEALGRALGNGRWFPQGAYYRCVCGNLELILTEDGAVVTAYQKRKQCKRESRKQLRRNYR